MTEKMTLDEIAEGIENSKLAPCDRRWAFSLVEHVRALTPAPHCKSCMEFGRNHCPVCTRKTPAPVVEPPACETCGGVKPREQRV